MLRLGPISYAVMRGIKAERSAQADSSVWFFFSLSVRMQSVNISDAMTSCTEWVSVSVAEAGTAFQVEESMNSAASTNCVYLIRCLQITSKAT